MHQRVTGLEQSLQRLARLTVIGDRRCKAGEFGTQDDLVDGRQPVGSLQLATREVRSRNSFA